MFWTSHSFKPDFDPRLHLQPSEMELYFARAKVAAERYVWSKALMPVFKTCLVHMSANVPGKVAYFSSIPNLVANRLTRTSPEMFLQRALSAAPGEIQGAWISEVMGKTLPELHFIGNDDPEGWYNVYRDGPKSCMAGSDRVRQYACPSSNLALAYAADDITITYRVIVNNKRMTYLRVYGEEEGKNYFIAALNKAGYTHSPDTLKDEPIRLDWAQCDNCGCDTLIGPYFDGAWDYVVGTNEDTGIIGNRGEPMNYSNGEILCGCHSDDDDDDEY